MNISKYQRSTKGTTITNTGGRLQTGATNYTPNIEAFGGGAAVNKNTTDYAPLVKGLQDVSNMTTKIGNDIFNTNAKNASMKFDQAFMEWQAEQKQKKGKDGMNSAEDFAKWKDTKLKEITSDLNDIEAGRFQSMADEQAARFGNWATGYGAGEKLKYEVGTQEAVMATQADMLARNIDDPVLSQMAIAQTGAAARELARLNGWGAEQTAVYEREALNKVLVPAIEAKIAEGDVGAARALMRAHEPILNSTSASKLQASAAREVKRQQSEARANHYRAERIAEMERVKAEKALVKQQEENMLSVVNTLRGTSDEFQSIAEYEENGLAAIGDIYNDDPKLREKALDLFREDIKYREQLRDAGAQSDLIEFEKQTQGQGVFEKEQVFQQGQWSDAGATLIREAIDGKRNKETDQNREAYSKLLTEFDEALARGEPLSDEKIKADAKEQNLTVSQTEKALQYKKDGGVRGLVTQSELKNAWKGIGEKNEPSDDFVRYVTDRLKPGAKATSAEIKQIAAGFIYEGLKPVTERSWFRSRNGETHAEAVTAGRGDEWLPEIDDEELTARGWPSVKELNGILERNGYQVSAFNRQIYVKTELLGIPDNRSGVRKQEGNYPIPQEGGSE